MAVYQFSIVGLCHHDFGDNLSELPDKIRNRKLLASIEHDNPLEKDAVIVYLGNKVVGYVRTDERLLACAIIRHLRKDVMRLTFQDLDVRGRVVTASIEVKDRVVARSHRKHDDIFDRITLNITPLPEREEKHRLHAMIFSLKTHVENNEAWDEDAEEYLAYIQDHLWLDVSAESLADIKQILSTMKKLFGLGEDYAEPIRRLTMTVDRMGSDETYLLQRQELFDMANSIDSSIYGIECGEEIRSFLMSDIATHAMGLDQCLNNILGILRYRLLPREKYRKVMTALAICIKHNRDEINVQSNNNYMKQDDNEEVRVVADARPTIQQTMNFYGSIGQQIAHVDKIEAHFDKESNMQVEHADEISEAAALPVQNPVKTLSPVENVCSFIRPGVTDDEQRLQIHYEIKNLVANFSLADICSYLSQMVKDGKILLPISPQVAFDELHRLGLPSAETNGYNYKTFCKYYRK